MQRLLITEIIVSFSVFNIFNSIHVYQFMISRILKKRHWSNKKRQHVSIRQNDELQLNWVVDLLQLMTEQLVFVNETLFNETTRWCHQVYASVDESARYQVFRKRKHFWSILSMYTIDDYLLCIDIHEDWFNDETFFAALKLSMICLLKLRKQLTLTATSAVFALTAVFTMILAATSALTLRAASALTLSEDFFVDEMLERMSEFSRDSFWLRRDDGMMASGVEGAKRMSALWKGWTASNLPVWFFYWFFNRALKVWECQECLDSIVNLGGGARQLRCQEIHSFLHTLNSCRQSRGTGSAPASPCGGPSYLLKWTENLLHSISYLSVAVEYRVAYRSRACGGDAWHVFLKGSVRGMEVCRGGGRGGSGGRVATSRLHWFIAGTGDGARRQRCERGGCAWCWIHIAMLVHATDFCRWAGQKNSRNALVQAAPRGTKIDTKSSRNPLE